MADRTPTLLVMQVGWGGPAEAEPYADTGGRRARFRLLVSPCGFWIELARGLLSARRWPVGTLMGAPGRVVGRRFGPQDVAEFVAYRSDADVARYQSWDAPYPPERGERFVAQMMTAHPDTPGEWFQFAVALRTTARGLASRPGMNERASDTKQTRP
jgi:hypothetical protein